jgi:tetraacyldisaccharide 4'-kinase
MVKILLYPFSLLYGIVIYIRNRLYDLDILKSREFDVPVISIGNITVGGTGKTPHVEYLADLLKDKFQVATLSRGYKRKTKGFLLVGTDMPASRAGDEPLQIKKKFPEIKVAVCENRVAGLENLLNSDKKNSLDVILLDDAFQHRRISAGINILLIDYNRPLDKDMLLPAGRLREGAVQVRRANIIIFTKCPANEVTPIKRRIIQKQIKIKPYQELFFTTFVYDKIKPLFSGNESIDDLYEDHSYGIMIVTGIASPWPVREYMQQFARETRIMSFPDHYYYSREDVRLIMRKFEELKSIKKIIVTTEKDAVRFADLTGLDESFRKVIYFLPVKVKFLNNEEISFNKKIINYVGENKSNRKLFKRKIQGKS